MNLYRYIPFESFVEIVQSQHLTFVSPLNWEDKFEGVMYRAVKTEQGRQRINKIAEDNGYDSMFGVLENDYAVSLTKYQCWCSQKDFVPMWSIYGYGNKSICIQTTKEKIKKLKYLSDGISEPVQVDILKIQYSDMGLEKQCLNALSKNEDNKTVLHMEKVFSIKRNAFSHEHEYRAFVGGFNNPEDWEEPIHVSLNCPVEDFIDDVLVNPLAPTWYVKIVEKFCSDHHIKFSGKSSLYEFNID